MRRRLLLSVAIGLLVVLIGAGTWLLATAPGLRWAYTFAQKSLPGKLDVDTLDGRLAGPILVEGLRYRHDGTDVRVDRATLDWSVAALLSLRLTIERLSLNGVRVSLSPPAPSSNARPPDLRLPLRVRIEQFEATDVAVERGGKSLLEIPAVRFAGGINDRAIEIDRLVIQTPTIDLTADGELALTTGASRLRVGWDVRLPTYPRTVGDAELSGNLSDLTIRARTNEPIISKIHATVKEPLTEETRWRAEIEIPSARLARLKPDLKGDVTLRANATGDRTRFESHGALSALFPPVPRVDGDFKLHGVFGGLLQLDHLQLRLPRTETKLAVHGNWDTNKRTGLLKANWNHLGWPLGHSPSITSPNGNLEILGTTSAYRVTLDADVRGNRLPPTQLRAKGGGNLARISLDHLELRTMNGTVTGIAQAAWSPRLDWSLRFAGGGLNPGTVWPEWQGKLAVEANATGNAHETHLSLGGVHGTLRGRAVNAHGKLVRRGSDYPTIALNVESGATRAFVTGSFQQRWDLAWQINASDLAAFWPQARGRLDGAGHLTGDRNMPSIDARLNGRDIVFADFRARELSVDISADRSDRQPSRAMLRLNDVTYAGREIKSVTLDGDGYIAKHSLRLTTAADDIELMFQLNGGYADQTWRGEVSQSRWRIGKDNWVLTQPAAWTVGTNRILIADTCWQESAARLCARMNREGGSDTLGISGNRVPLALLAPFLAQPIEVRGTIDAEAAFRVRSGQLQEGNASLVASPGTVRMGASSAATLAYQSARIDLRVNEAGLQAHAELRLASGDGGSADVALPQFNKSLMNSADQPLQGKIQFAVRDLSPFAALLPDIEELRGAVRANLAMQGTLANPQVRGDARLTDSSARIPTLGIRLQEARIVATPEGRAIRLNGYARSGDGELGLSGRLVLGTNAAWQAELRLAGSQFLIVNVPEANVAVTPDLRLTVSPGVIRAQGDVAIPRARLAPRPRTPSIAPSRDVVIVGATETSRTDEPAWDVHAEINVALGNDVTFEGFGLTGNITGGITLIDTPSTATLARGELRVVKGRYEAYGQKLQIERGRLLFAGGPVEDPGIDARAVRRVESITAGIEVTGTLKSPQLTLFSDPPMGQSDTLSYLLFGKPVETANASQGAALASAARALQLRGGEQLAQRLGARFGIEEVDIQSGSGSDASLVLGKRLSPKLYINYSIGLFEPINVFRIRYELTTNWVLQAESGLSQGADLLFTIER